MQLPPPQFEVNLQQMVSLIEFKAENILPETLAYSDDLGSHIFIIVCLFIPLHLLHV